MLDSSEAVGMVKRKVACYSFGEISFMCCSRKKQRVNRAWLYASRSRKNCCQLRDYDCPKGSAAVYAGFDDEEMLSESLGEIENHVSEVNYFSDALVVTLHSVYHHFYLFSPYKCSSYFNFFRMAVGSQVLLSNAQTMHTRNHHTLWPQISL